MDEIVIVARLLVVWSNYTIDEVGEENLFQDQVMSTLYTYSVQYTPNLDQFPRAQIQLHRDSSST